MKEIISRELLERVLKVVGVQEQFEMLHEESLELALSIHQYRRKNKGSDDERMLKIVDEVADVKLMTAQIEMIFDDWNLTDKLNERIEFKKERLIKRLDEYENKTERNT